MLALDPPPAGVLVEMIPAAVVSGAILMLGWFWRDRGWTLPLALGLGYSASHVWALELPAFNPPDTTLLVFHFALAGALLGCLDATKVPRAARYGLLGLAATAVPWLLLHGVDGYSWILSAAVAVAALALVWRAHDVAGFAQPLALLVVAGGGALALENAGSGRLAQQSGMIAAAVGAAVLVGLMDRRWRPRGGVIVPALLLPSLWIGGHFYAELPLTSAGLLTAAPLAATRRRWWIGALVTLSMVAIAVYLAHQANLPDPDDPYAGY